MKQLSPTDIRTIYLTISGVSGTCELAANYDEVKRRYYMPSLALKTPDGEIDEFWDNSTYLFVELYDSLNNYIFTDESPELSTYLMEHRDELLSLLDKGVELGWHKI